MSNLRFTLTAAPSLLYGTAPVNGASAYSTNNARWSHDIDAAPGDTASELTLSTQIISGDLVFNDEGEVDWLETAEIIDVALTLEGDFTFAADQPELRGETSYWTGLASRVSLFEGDQLVASWTGLGDSLNIGDEATNPVNRSGVWAFLETLSASGGQANLDGRDNFFSARLARGDDHDGLLRVNGKGGDDLLYGSAANDRLAGGRGDDRIIGDGGLDRVKGGGGNDQITISSGGRANGNKGADRLIAEGYNISLKGGGGTDTLSINSSLPGLNWLHGGGGADSFVLGGGPYVRGLSGTIIRDFDWAEGDRITLQTGSEAVEIRYIGDVDFSANHDQVAELQFRGKQLTLRHEDELAEVTLRGVDALPDDLSLWLQLDDTDSLSDSPQPDPAAPAGPATGVTFAGGYKLLSRVVEEQGFANDTNPLDGLAEGDISPTQIDLAFPDIFAGELSDRDALTFRLIGDSFALVDGQLTGQPTGLELLRDGEIAVSFAGLPEAASLSALQQAEGFEDWWQLLSGNGLAYTAAPQGIGGPLTSTSSKPLLPVGTGGANTILGTPESEQVSIGGVTSFTASMGDGDDRAFAFDSGQADIRGENGDDDIRAEQVGDVTLRGGRGDDEILVTESSGGVFGGAGDDLIEIDARQTQVTVSGGSGADHFELDTPLFADGIIGASIVDFDTSQDTISFRSDILFTPQAEQLDYIGSNAFQRREDGLVSVRLDEDKVLSFDADGDGRADPVGMVHLPGVEIASDDPLDWLMFWA